VTESGVILVLTDAGDPLRRSHGIARPADYRLKMLLKDLLRGRGSAAAGCSTGAR
jgi:hypothetical protein